MFARNESSLDRVVRVVLGGTLLMVAQNYYGLASARPLGVVMGTIAAVLLFTGLTGFSLLYKMIGHKTKEYGYEA